MTTLTGRSQRSLTWQDTGWPTKFPTFWYRLPYMIQMTTRRYPALSWRGTRQRKTSPPHHHNLQSQITSTLPVSILPSPPRIQRTPRMWKISSSPAWRCWGWLRDLRYREGRRGRGSWCPPSRRCWSVPCVETECWARFTSATRVTSCVEPAGLDSGPVRCAGQLSVGLLSGTEPWRDSPGLFDFASLQEE